MPSACICNWDIEVQFEAFEAAVKGVQLRQNSIGFGFDVRRIALGGCRRRCLFGRNPAWRNPITTHLRIAAALNLFSSNRPSSNVSRTAWQSPADMAKQINNFVGVHLKFPFLCVEFLLELSRFDAAHEDGAFTVLWRAEQETVGAVAVFAADEFGFRRAGLQPQALCASRNGTFKVHFDFGTYTPAIVPPGIARARSQHAPFFTLGRGPRRPGCTAATPDVFSARL